MMNQKVAGILYEIADLLELKEERFKPQAYRRAAYHIETLQEDVKDVMARNALKDIPGVGEAIEGKIKEIVETGRLRYLDELRAEFPAGLMQVLEVPDIGPKTVMRLYKELKITNINDLRQAAEEHRIRKMRGFGERTEENILKGIRYLEKSRGRMLLGYAHPIAVGMVAYLKEKGGLSMVDYAGSLRRMKETVGDIDILAGSDEPSKVTETFINYPEVEDVVARGDTRSSVRLRTGAQVDLRVVSPESYGAALLYFTGSKEHNIALRTMAMGQGYRLNEYGLFKKEDGTVIASRDEKEIYGALGLDWIPPEIRECIGELAMAKEHKLPRLVEMSDIKGDLHVHTDSSDGADSIERMVLAAKARGYEYIGITDHSQSLKIANGLDISRLRENIKVAERLTDELAPFKVFIGAEVEIDDRGKLDYPSDVLDQLDYVVGAVHTRFRMTEAEMTGRMITAMGHNKMKILAHPTGRLIGQREAYAIDMERIMDEARAKGVWLEVNSFPDRLDLGATACRAAVENGNTLVINSDSHKVAHLDNILYGVATARRGLVTKDRVANTRPMPDIF
ncbi:MAG: DNA polymerase/3'-5' exonuclease PolX [Methanomassiliicoccales archaeon]|nr:MAG: DNA polymerase/3'-5' exonuclease PolX [Methanomassiliicoccales archaeon]